MTRNYTLGLLVCLLAWPAIAGDQVSLTFTTTTHGGSYGPNNVVAVWVKNSSGTFVKTIGRWAEKREDSLGRWVTASGIDADGVMGATRGDHSSSLSIDWDLTDKAGSTVPDGNYVIHVECTEADSGTPSVYTSIPFNKNGVAQSTNPSNSGGIINMSLVYTVSTPPVAQNQTVATAEDTAKAITLVATDAEDNPLTYAIVDHPGHGVLAGAAPNVVYTPDTDWNGQDTFTFRANDGSSNSNTATVTVNVSAQNDAPNILSISATPDTITFPSTTTLTVIAEDPEGDDITYTWSKTSGQGSVTFTPNGTTAAATSVASFGMSGSYVLEVTATDGSDASTDSVMVNVQSSGNTAPFALAQSVTAAQAMAKDITLAATDPDGDDLTYTIVTLPSHGTLSGSEPNVTYTSDGGYSGSDSFTFKANDETEDSNTATVSITVITNAAPVAESQSLTFDQDDDQAVVLVAIDDDENPLSYSIVDQPDHGSISGVLPSLIYSPAPGWSGVDSFTFKANDGYVDSNTATITLTVRGIPVAEDQSLSVLMNSSLNLTLKATDPEDDALTYSIVSDPSNGVLTGSIPNLTYTPTSGWSGDESFSFKVNDGNRDSNTATVRIRVKSAMIEPGDRADTDTNSASCSLRTGADPAGWLPVVLVLAFMTMARLTRTAKRNWIPLHRRNALKHAVKP